MKRPTPDVVFALAIVARQHREVLTYLEGWCEEELAALPFASLNTAVAQGRCQVLTEMVKLISEAPKTVADPRWQQQSDAHRKERN